MPVTKVEELTGFPECLDGRVKTLHPRVHAGILADLRLDDHRRQLAELGVEPFDLVVVNLYPFRETVASGARRRRVRGADRHRRPVDGPRRRQEPPVGRRRHQPRPVRRRPGRRPRRRLRPHRPQAAGRRGVPAHRRVRRGRGLLVRATATPPPTTRGFPDFLGATYERSNVLRYGENPHQPAALYTDGSGGGLAEAEQLHGKEMSYNNYMDTDAARRAAYDHAEPCVAIIKHANPCGIAVGADVAEAHRKAHACDPLSAFGGVIAVNRPVTRGDGRAGRGDLHRGHRRARRTRTARSRSSPARRTSACCAAPDAPDAPGRGQADRRRRAAPGHRPAPGRGRRPGQLDAGHRRGRCPTDELAELAFAWRACRAVKSNAILLAKDGATVGVGMGQVNRVDSAKLAVERAGEERARGSYAASDAFFPFPDGLEVLTAAGVKAVVQPGGSVRDELVVEAAKKAGVTMYFTGTRHFFH